MPTRANQNRRRTSALAHLRAGHFASLDEAAQFAGVSRQRVHQWCEMHAIDWRAAWAEARNLAVATMIAKEDQRMSRKARQHEAPGLTAALLASGNGRPKAPSKRELRAAAEAAVASGTVPVRRLPPSPPAVRHARPVR